MFTAGNTTKNRRKYKSDKKKTGQPLTGPAGGQIQYDFLPVAMITIPVW